jgi:hypothetical protein
MARKSVFPAIFPSTKKLLEVVGSEGAGAQQTFA